MPLNMLTTVSRIYREVADEYLAALPANQPRPEPEDIELDVINMLALKIEALNDEITRGSKQRIPLAMPPYVIARIVNALWPVYRIPLAGAETDQAYDVLGIYQEDGPNKGIYMTSDLMFQRLLKRFNTAATNRDFSEFMSNLNQMADRKLPCRDRDLIAVNNGIFDYSTKQLRPFDPDLVFLSKSRVDYVPNPANPVLHNPNDNTDWDVESWVAELSDDPEIVNLIWEVLGAIIRPNVAWNKSAWFYSETGNNGKGTLCALMRNLCGPGTYASTSLADFGKEFLLEPLMRASAIIVDENDVGIYIDKGANLKAVITNDVIQINRKYEKPLAFQFHGFMVQCLNEMPKVKDKSESFYRRQLFVPFTKCFTGAERKYIKSDYLARKEVLEYVLWRILNMDYYELSNPAACQAVLDSYKQYNDPLRQFVDDIFPQLVWDTVPLAYLFDCYKSWLKANNPGGTALGKRTFNQNIMALAPQIDGWILQPSRVYPSPTLFSKPEPLTVQYELKNWMNPAIPANDPLKRAVPIPKHCYVGAFIRVGSIP